MTDEYELIPRKMIQDLKSELNELKHNSYSKSSKKSPKRKKGHIDDVSSKLDILIDIFKSAKKDAEHINNKSQLDEINSKIEGIESEIKKMSQAIVALARMIKQNNGNSQLNSNIPNNQNNQDKNNEDNDKNNSNGNINPPSPPNDLKNNLNNPNKNNQNDNQKKKKKGFPKPPSSIKGLLNKNKK